jgi:hypothetical protein
MAGLKAKSKKATFRSEEHPHPDTLNHQVDELSDTTTRPQRIYAGEHT